MPERLPTKITLTTPKVGRLPAKVAARVDAFYQLREKRLAYGREMKRAEKVLNALKHREDEIAKDLYKQMRQLGGATKLSGGVATFSPGDAEVFTVEDWDAFYEHIKSTGEFELLERRPARGALKERSADNKLPEGIKSERVFAYSLTKVGSK